jgi:hypothetical protein
MTLVSQFDLGSGSIGALRTPFSLASRRPSGEAKALLPAGAAAVRAVVGQNAPTSSLVWYDGDKDELAAGKKGVAGTIVQDPETKAWRAVVWPDRAAKHLRGLGLSKEQAVDIIGAQEAVHAFYGTSISRQDNELLGDAGSLFTNPPAQTVSLARMTAQAVHQGTPSGYETTVRASLNALGRTAERFGLGNGHPEERGRGLMRDIVKTIRADGPYAITLDSLGKYARAKGIDPQAFMTEMVRNYVDVYKAGVSEVRARIGR